MCIIFQHFSFQNKPDTAHRLFQHHTVQMSVKEDTMLQIKI